MAFTSPKFGRNSLWLLPCLAAHCAWAEPLTPGSIGDMLKTPPQLQRPAPSPEVRTPPSAPTQIPEAGSARITVHEFVLTGNSVFSAEQLQPLLQPFLDTPLSLAGLYAAADRVADFYQARGYTLASVAIPPQTVDEGRVTLQIIEGRIGKLRFEGNDDYGDPLLQGYFKHAKPETVYRSQDLQQDLYAVNDLPGLKARAVLTPGETFGHSDVVVETDEKHFGVDAAIDNYGRQEVGEYRYSLGLTLNNPGRIGDQLRLAVLHSNTDRLNYGSAAYNLPLGSNGWRLDAAYGRALFKLAPPFDAGGKNQAAQMDVGRTWLHNANDQLATSVGYSFTDANADLSGLPLSATRISLMTLGVNATHVWRDGSVTQAIGSLHTNFQQADAGNLDRERGRAEVSLQHLQSLGPRLQALAEFDGVYSPDPLADTEQIAIGGPSTVRGFAPTEVRGDRGWYSRLTLRSPLFAGPVLLIPRVFYDTGVVGILNHPPGGKERDSLSGTGIGTDVNYRQYSLHIEWAYPVDSRPTSDGRDSGRIYLSLSAAM